MQLAHVVVKDAALFHASRHAADDMQWYFHPNRLVHGDFEKVYMEHVAFDRIDLEVAEQGCPFGLRLYPGDIQRNQRCAARM